MSFDNGFSTGNVVFVGAITLYPIAVILYSIIAWMIHKRKKRTTIMVNLIPLIWILSIGLLFII